MDLQILDLQPNETQAVDGYVNNGSPLSSFGNSIFLRVGTDASGYIQRVLIKPDISSLPSNARITKTSVKLYNYGVINSSFYVYEITSDWSEMVTFLTCPTIATTPLRTLNLNIPDGSLTEIDITELAKKWQTGVNRGFMIKAIDTNQSQASFYSASYSNTALRPIYHYEYYLANRRNGNPIINETQGGAIIL